MTTRTNLRLLGRLAADTQRLGFDALGEPFGGALPLRPCSLARPAVLNRLLRGHGIGTAVDARVATVELLDVKSISSNCNNVVVRIGAADECAPLPSTLFVKLPSKSLWTRLFCNLLGIWRNECHFYRHAASRVPFRVPKPYVVADRGSRFVLVLEDLHAADDLELFTNPDLIDGVSLERARQCLRALASLHATFHGVGVDERASILQPDEFADWLDALVT